MNSHTKSRPSTAPGARPTILLVDDDAAVRHLVGRVLREEGYTALDAASGSEAVAIAATEPIDLVLLDLNLPGESGWDVLERLTTCHSGVAVIVITARSNQLFTSLGAGVGALLGKPLDFPTLLDTVRALLAEPVESRRARLDGHLAGFRYHPSVPPASRTPRPAARTAARGM